MKDLCVDVKLAPWWWFGLLVVFLPTMCRVSVEGQCKCMSRGMCVPFTTVLAAIDDTWKSVYKQKSILWWYLSRSSISNREEQKQGVRSATLIM